MPSGRAGYGSAAQAVTISPAGLAANAARASAVIDNSADGFVGAFLFVQVRTGGSASTGEKAVLVYAYGTNNPGSDYSDTATGADAAVTLTSPPNLRFVGAVNAPLASTTYNSPLFSPEVAFGGVLPARWGVVLVNATGVTLDATAGNFKVSYQGFYGDARAT